MSHSIPSATIPKLMAPMTIPAIARPRPEEFGALRIWARDVMPRIKAMIPKIGTQHAQPVNTPRTPRTNEPIAVPGGDELSCGCDGGGGGCHGRSIGPRTTGADSPGVIQPPPAGGSRGSHCVADSDGSLDASSYVVGRMRGSQFGSAAGVRSSRRMLPSSVQNVSQASEYCL